MRQGQEYLVEPLRNHESMVKPAHSIVTPQSDKTLWIRVANANSQSEVLQKGEFVATLYTDVCVAYRGEKDGASQKVMRYKIGEDLTGDQRKELQAVIQEYETVMWRPGQPLPVVEVGIEHKLELKQGAKAKMSKPRRLSQAEMVEVRKEIEDLLQQGLIETSSSPWSAPIVCA